MNFKSIEELWYNEVTDRENFYLNIESDVHTFLEGTSFSSSSESWYQGEKIYSFSKEGDFQNVTIFNKDSRIEVTEHYRFFKDSNAVQVYNTVKNKGEQPFNILHFSSAVINIDITGNLPWNDENRFKIYTVNSHWSAEAQWKISTFSDFGIVPGRNDDVIFPVRHNLRSEGSWSTARYYPIVIIEDTEQNVSYFVEHEGGLNWEISFGGEWSRIVLETNSANFHHDGWYKNLNKNEEFSTTTAIIGRVEGDFEQAIKHLIKAKRQLSLVESTMPLCYNVFLGGVWGEPTKENLLPLIKAAGELGCEVFCIDAGWYRKAYTPSENHLLGDYVPDAVRFGEEGLKGILENMQQNNMLPGLWFEFEAVNIKMQGARNGEGMLKRNGNVISKKRGIYDIGDPLVRKHLFDAVDRVYNMGMRFIKNDHNFTQGLGFGDKDYAQNNRRNMEDFYSFIDELLEKYPDLIIENCGSGGMRSDNGTLKHFHLQSTSDQETYYNNPTIVAGSIALMLPEKAGIWGSPYATTVHENNKFYYEKEQTEQILEDVKQRNKSTHATVFNMVTCQLGCMYLSGRLDLMNEENKLLVKEGIELYKKNRDFIKKAYPIYPSGFSHIGKKGFYTAGLTDENCSKIKLAVWKNHQTQNEFSLDLSKYAKSSICVTGVYPSDTAYSVNGNTLNVSLDKDEHQAAFFELNVK